MPTAPLRPCNHPGCRELVAKGCCKAHTRQREQERGSAHERGYTRQWSRAAAAFRQRHPTCAMCEAAGRVTPATCVDHIVPHKGDMVLFNDVNNLQSLCASCHSTKTANEDGGWGRAIAKR